MYLPRKMVRMDTHLKRLTLITNDELALLNAGWINDMDDLGYLKYADIQSLIIGSTTVTWRKIERVALFIDGGETVITVTTMADITANLRTGGVPSFTTRTSTASIQKVDPSRGVLIIFYLDTKYGSRQIWFPPRQRSMWNYTLFHVELYRRGTGHGSLTDHRSF